MIAQPIGRLVPAAQRFEILGEQAVRFEQVIVNRQRPAAMLDRSLEIARGSVQPGQVQMVLLVAGISGQSQLELPFRLGQVFPAQKVQAQAPMGLSRFVVQGQRDFILASALSGVSYRKRTSAYLQCMPGSAGVKSNGFTILLQSFVETPVRHQTVADGQDAQTNYRE